MIPSLVKGGRIGGMAVLMLAWIYSQAFCGLVSDPFLPEIVFGGFLESRHSIQVQSSNDTLSSETLARLELSGYWENATLFTATNLSENHLLGDESGVSLHEGYLDLATEQFSLRAGRQIIIWGQADGIRITDNISPLDTSEYITRDFDELRLGVDAVNLRYEMETGSLQLIWIPFFRAGILPDADSPWYLDSGSELCVLEVEEPDPGLKDSEAALRYALYLPGADLALSYFYTWGDYPAYYPVSDSEAYRAEYYRRHILGADFSKPFGDFVFRAEAAWFHGDLISSATSGIDPYQKDRVKWLGGLDWYPGGNISLSAQYTRSRILNPGTDLAEQFRQDIATLSLSKKLFREKLTLSAMAYLDPDKGDSLARVSSEYRVMDDLTLFVGADLFSGDRQGSFGQYSDNTQVWTKVKYHF